jgi:hypothetical protein
MFRRSGWISDVGVKLRADLFGPTDPPVHDDWYCFVRLGFGVLPYPRVASSSGSRSRSGMRTVQKNTEIDLPDWSRRTIMQKGSRLIADHGIPSQTLSGFLPPNFPRF